MPDGFEKIELLSQARSYEVWDAWDESRAARVILKLVRDDAPEPARARRRLLAEGRLLERLGHPHIVRAYETRERPEAMIVMESVGGATLAHMVESQPLSAVEIAHLGLHLCSALAFLHRLGQLHLDLKPSNVIGEAGRAKLIDLGLSRPPGPVSAGAGTWSYLSPEQARGGPVSEATDIWGLGATLFDCVCGFPPFDDPTLAGDRADESEEPDVYPQLERRARPVSEAASPPAEPELGELIDLCLEPAPADRPGLGEVTARLEAIAGLPDAERRLSRQLAGRSQVPA